MVVSRAWWCSTCGKRGKNCRNRSTCLARVIERGPFPTGAAWPKPTDEWYDANYRRTDGRGYRYARASMYDPDVRQHYAYDVAMGRDQVAAEQVAA